MKRVYFSETAEALKNIPNGTILKTRRKTEEGGALPTERLETWTEGKGAIESFAVFPGIEVSLHRYAAERVRFRHAADGGVLAVNHCRAGRIGWHMRDGGTIYLGPGDLCIHSMDDCAESEIELPLGYYEGAAVAADLRALAAGAPEILREAGFDAREIYRRFCAGGSPFGIPSSASAEAAFSPLYAARGAMLVPYCKLKAIEVLLCIMGVQPAAGEITRYGSEQTELIKEIRNFLMENLDKRFTIEELSKKYLLNTSTLKAVFKAVYGQPVASYVRERRMKLAAKLLRESDASVAEIARAVGYETQGKFTKAFKESAGETPAEYRRKQKWRSR